MHMAMHRHPAVLFRIRTGAVELAGGLNKRLDQSIVHRGVVVASNPDGMGTAVEIHTMADRPTRLGKGGDDTYGQDISDASRKPT